MDLKRRVVAREAERELHHLEFIGVDGEGIWEAYQDVTEYDEETGEPYITRQRRQRYVLLSVGDQSLYHEDERELTHNEIFRFLYDQFEAHPNAVFVGFSLGYDFNFWMKSLSGTTAWRLLTPEGRHRRKPKKESPRRALWPVRDGGLYTWFEGEDYIEHYVTPEWEFDILGTKKFSLRPYAPDRKKTVHHKDGTVTEKKDPYPWMHICDTFPFFQQAFLGVMNPDPKKNPPEHRVWTDAEYEIIRQGKEDRTEAYHITPEMIRYNVLENDILGRIMAQMNEGLVADGIKLSKSQWYGPGQAAQAWMGLPEVSFPTSQDVQDAVPKWALDAAHKTYYGGWFEIFAHGHVPGTSYDYDINSAYPTVIEQLPCLLHGKWSRTKTLPKRVHGDRRLHIVDVELNGSNFLVGPAPHRAKDGSILRPKHTRGWHWWHEIEMSQRAGLIKDMKIRAVVTYDPCACPSPGAGVRELYEGRKAVGKDTPRGKAKKLVYNSAYGKCAQSVGKPKFANPIYASLITSGCRTKILEAIATHPTGYDSLLMIATDGIVFREPHPNLPISGELGDWDTKTFENLTLFLPGMYWDDGARKKIAAGKLPSMKLRGVSARYMPQVVTAIDPQWRKVHDWVGDNPPWPKMTLDIPFAQISAKQAITRERWDLCAWIDEKGTRELSGNPRAKRKADGVKHFGDITRTYIHPYELDDKGNQRLETTYYDPRLMFGMDPDHPGAEELLRLGLSLIDEMDTPDGPVAMGLMEEFDHG